jgi:hypothetical protein
MANKVMGSANFSGRESILGSIYFIYEGGNLGEDKNEDFILSQKEVCEGRNLSQEAVQGYKRKPTDVEDVEAAGRGESCYLHQGKGCYLVAFQYKRQPSERDLNGL